MRINLLFVLAFLITAFSCSNKTELPQGIWRATLTTESGAEIPFNFNLNSNKGKYSIDILTGDNKYTIDEVSFKDDRLHITMPLFGGEFKLKFENNLLKGEFIRATYTMQCLAKPGVNYRFFENNKPLYDAGGKWAITFGKGTNAVGEFVQKGDILTGSVLTASGDFRFLEGSVNDKGDFNVSGFDGGFVLLFTGKMTDAKTISDGKFYSGYKGFDTFTAIADENATLPDAYQITSMRPGDTKLMFTFTDIEGKQVSLSDDKFTNKPVIVQFSGSWCPNCLDETAFLSEVYEKYKGKVEIICLAFERSTEYDKARAEAMKLVKRCNVKYDVLITCLPPKPDEIEKAMPMLVNFKAFPTTIVIDKKGEVRKIHSGFAGPGTGEHYNKFVKEFTSEINSLIAE